MKNSSKGSNQPSSVNPVNQALEIIIGCIKEEVDHLEKNYGGYSDDELQAYMIPEIFSNIVGRIEKKMRR